MESKMGGIEKNFLIRMLRSIIYSFLSLTFFSVASAQDSAGYWHGKLRTVQYLPPKPFDNYPHGAFEIRNGHRRFNRALYGTNTGFRVEAGDLPEFAMYLPGMGGNFKMGIIAGNDSKWLTDAKYIKAVYTPGKMSYEIKDPVMGDAVLSVSVLALGEEEGMIVQAQFKNLKK